jgi:hypothetical protein
MAGKVEGKNEIEDSQCSVTCQMVCRNSKCGHFLSWHVLPQRSERCRVAAFRTALTCSPKRPDVRASGIYATSSTASSTSCGAGAPGGCYRASIRRGQLSIATIAASDEMEHGSASIPICVSKCAWPWAERLRQAVRFSIARASRPRKRGRCWSSQCGL